MQARALGSRVQYFSNTFRRAGQDAQVENVCNAIDGALSFPTGSIDAYELTMNAEGKSHDILPLWFEQDGQGGFIVRYLESPLSSQDPAFANVRGIIGSQYNPLTERMCTQLTQKHAALIPITSYEIREKNNGWEIVAIDRVNGKYRHADIPSPAAVSHELPDSAERDKPARKKVQFLGTARVNYRPSPPMVVTRSEDGVTVLGREAGDWGFPDLPHNEFFTLIQREMLPFDSSVEKFALRRFRATTPASGREASYRLSRMAGSDMTEISEICYPSAMPYGYILKKETDALPAVQEIFSAFPQIAKPWLQWNSQPEIIITNAHNPEQGFVLNSTDPLYQPLSRMLKKHGVEEGSRERMPILADVLPDLSKWLSLGSPGGDPPGLVNAEWGSDYGVKITNSDPPHQMSVLPHTDDHYPTLANLLREHHVISRKLGALLGAYLDQHEDIAHLKDPHGAANIARLNQDFMERTQSDPMLFHFVAARGQPNAPMTLRQVLDEKHGSTGEYQSDTDKELVRATYHAQGQALPQGLAPKSTVDAPPKLRRHTISVARVQPDEEMMMEPGASKVRTPSVSPSHRLPGANSFDR
jgi:hypothetical protein